MRPKSWSPSASASTSTAARSEAVSDSSSTMPSWKTPDNPTRATRTSAPQAILAASDISGQPVGLELVADGLDVDPEPARGLRLVVAGLLERLQDQFALGEIGRAHV